MIKPVSAFSRLTRKLLAPGGSLALALAGGYFLLQIFYPPPQEIVFLSDRASGLGIYSMRADGSGQKRLSSYQPRNSIWHDLKTWLPAWLGPYLPSHVYNHSPRWSADGTRIVYASRPTYEDEIFIMNANGMDKIRLTHNANFDSYAVWSPNGDHIAFRSLTDNRGSWYLFVMEADGQNLIRLAPSLAVESFPTWSPDSTRIAFMDGDSLYRVHVDGTGLARLTQAREDPVWSPDGDQIVFVCDSPRFNFEFCSIRPDSSGLVQLTDDGGTIKGNPVWSPDGRKIAFEAMVVAENNLEIFVMESDGSNLVRLTHNMAYDGNITWSPDNAGLAFASNRDGDLEIYVINIDGSGLVQLTYNQVDDYSPSWRP